MNWKLVKRVPIAEVESMRTHLKQEGILTFRFVYRGPRPRHTITKGPFKGAMLASNTFTLKANAHSADLYFGY